MKHNGFLATVIINITIWIVTGVVTVVAMNITGNAWWAFLMFIPVLCGFSYKEKHNDTDKTEKD